MNTQDKLGGWRVSAQDFPRDGGADQKWMFLLNYAILAPSSHNSQPWLFRIQGHELELLADRRRALPVVDPSNRELIMSCGAALQHLRLAARYFGYATVVEYLPEDSIPDLLARISLGEGCETSTDDIVEFSAIELRRTNRMPFDKEPLAPRIYDLLSQTALREGAWLRFVGEEDARFRLAHLIGRADREQWRNKSFRAELSSWLTPNDSPRRDGIPGYAHGHGDLVSHAEPLIVRTFDLGKGQAARDQEIALHSPALAVLGTNGDSPAEWLDAGQALSAVLLRARAENVWASFLNQPLECEDIRSELADVIGGGYPQIVLRLGYGPEVKPTPRRPLIQLLLQPRNRPIRIHPGAV